MTITLSAETQKLLEDRMKLWGMENPDDAVRAALQDSDEMEDDRSPETLAAIRRGMEDARAGRTRPWEEVKKELIARNANR
jgi:predicted transcriptional regulator